MEFDLHAYSCLETNVTIRYYPGPIHCGHTAPHTTTHHSPGHTAARSTRRSSTWFCTLASAWHWPGQVWTCWPDGVCSRCPRTESLRCCWSRRHWLCHRCRAMGTRWRAPLGPRTSCHWTRWLLAVAVCCPYGLQARAWLVHGTIKALLWCLFPLDWCSRTDNPRKLLVRACSWNTSWFQY